jgi:thiol-disulfide isomerase/thioredoxin
LIAGSSVLAGAAPPAVEWIDAAKRESRPAADALKNLEAIDLDGRQWTAAEMRGRVVLLDFWATWCAPCLAELPRLKALRDRHSREHFEILGISLDVTSRQSFVSWLNRNRIDWPQVHERAGYSAGVPRLFGIDRLPRTILVGRDGTIAAVDLRGDHLAARIDELVRAER